MWPLIDGSGVVDISPNKMASLYLRDTERRSPYNYFLDGQAGISAAPAASVTRDVGFVFDDTAPTGGYPVYRARTEWGSSSADFQYDSLQGDFLVGLNDFTALEEETGEQQRAQTVVLQYVKQSESEFFDKGGGNTPHAETIGTGTGIVLRDGRAFDVTWSRPDAASGTTFQLRDGSPMPFKPGQSWIVLLTEDRRPVIEARPSASPSSSPASGA
jgi:hypothetical protein